jgi:catalase (peroxidase I)
MARVVKNPYADMLAWTLAELYRIVDLTGGGDGSKNTEENRHRWSVEASESLERLRKKYGVHS